MPLNWRCFCCFRGEKKSFIDSQQANNVKFFFPSYYCRRHGFHLNLTFFSIFGPSLRLVFTKTEAVGPKKSSSESNRLLKLFD